MEEQVILVNERDEPIGLMGKMEAHEKGLLHRAFSVFIFNSKQEVLLQQRASYKAPFDNRLTEHEYDHVLVGYSDAQPQINPEEVASWKWLSLEAIKEDILQAPEQYTAWFKIIFEKFYHYLLDKQ